MTETRKTEKKGSHRLARFIAVLSASLCLLLLGIYLSATIYLRTPAAARQASQLLSDYLHYPVTVTGLALAGGTLSVNGLTLGNPARFRGGELASVRSIAISPDLWAFLVGRRSFDGIAIRGLRITVARNEKDDWNFKDLARLLSGKKGGGETSIKRLTVSQSALAVEGLRLDNLALHLSDLSTKGTTGSRFLLTCKDAGGNPLRVEGSARLGAAPSLEVALAAPSFSLQTIARTFGRAAGPALGDGRGALSLTVRLRDGKVAAEGKLGFGQLALPVKNGAIPVTGELAVAGRYDVKSDVASLDRCSLRLDGIVTAHAAGTVRQARKKRSFAATVSVDKIEVNSLFALLPQQLRRDLVPAGTLAASPFRISGDAAHGITAGGGTLSLRGGGLTRGGRLLVQDLSADLSLTRAKEGWQTRGRLFQGVGRAGGVLQAVDAPFSALFSGRLKPISAEAPSIAATVLGIPATGRVGYRSGEPAPLTCLLEVRRTPLPPLNRLLAGKNVAFSAGTAALSLRAAGSGPREFRGKVRGELAGLAGTAFGKRFALKGGESEAEFSGSGGRLSVAGKLSGSGAVVDDRRGEFAVSYGLRQGAFYLADGTVRLDRAELRLGRLSGALPQRQRAGGVTRLPLRLELSGLAARSGAAGLEGLSGRLALDYLTAEGRRWLEGGGSLAVAKLLYNGGDIGALAGALSFTGAGAAAAIDGTLLDGRLAGAVTLDPFAERKKVDFTMNLDGARCARLAALDPGRRAVKIAGGVLGVKLAGSYAAGAGVRCRVEADGREIALTGKGGKRVLADGRVRTVCELSGGDLFIREGVAGAGKGVELKGTGEVARFLSPERSGEISLAVAETPLDALLDTFIAILPRGLQEASATGTVGAGGRVRLGRKQVLVDGAVTLKNAALEIPAQKFSAEEMAGTIPFSLDLTGAAGGGRAEKRRYSRDNYPALLAALRQAAQTERSFRIGRVRFGGVELGETSLAVRAGNGLVELTSLESALFEGTLRGEGYFRYGKKVRYGADLTVDDLSLRALCNASPKTRGYIAGRVDGLFSLSGEGLGLNGLRGFTEIWARSAPGEKMLVSKEFLQKLAGRKFKGLFFRADRPYDRGEIRGYLENGYLTFDLLDISHTNIFGVKDLNVTVAPVQNRITLEHLFTAIREAATRGKGVGAGEAARPAPVETEFKWQE